MIFHNEALKEFAALNAWWRLQQQNKEPESVAAGMVRMEWETLITLEGVEAAKQFHGMCSERQECPSTHLMLSAFLKVGLEAIIAASEAVLVK